MRSRSSLMVVALLALCGCAALRGGSSAAACVPAKDDAAVAAIVRDTSGRPVPGMPVHANWMSGEESDSAGVACLRELPPDSVLVRVGRVGWVSESASVRLEQGRTTEVSFTVRRATRPCCQLDGAWQVSLSLDSAGLDQKPTARRVEGLWVFSPRLPAVAPWQEGPQDSIVRHESGFSGLDLAPFFGGPYAKDVSTTIFGGGEETIMRELVGTVVAGDRVEMTLIPRMSHGGLSLEGRIAADTIRGRWSQNAYCCGATGTFVMVRRPLDAAATALVDGALRAFERQRLVADSANAEDRRQQGFVRLRAWDEAVSRHVEVRVMLTRHSDQPGGYLSTPERSGASGWSEYRALPPGTYEVVLTDYPCGGEVQFADELWVRANLPPVRVTITPGARIDQELRFDSRKIRAASSYQGKGGTQCGTTP